jgi:drug/metabolite transporter (DMT)-like permease
MNCPAFHDASKQLTPVSFSLLATLGWGFSDFIGGLASRRSNAFLLTTIAHFSGFLLMLCLAITFSTSFPSRHGIAWSMAAGVSGGVSMAVFYHALSIGKMGLTAPVAASVGAAIPMMVGVYTEGLPGTLPLAGFALAGIGIWLISRTEDGDAHPAGLGLAALAGIGFAGFFLCMKQAGEISPLWAATFSRCASLLAAGLLVVISRQFRPLVSAGIGLGLLAGLLESVGTAVFIKASQAGRLDAAVVISSLYPAVTVILARVLLGEHFTPWRMAGLVAALVAVPMIAT